MRLRAAVHLIRQRGPVCLSVCVCVCVCVFVCVCDTHTDTHTQPLSVQDPRRRDAGVDEDLGREGQWSLVGYYRGTSPIRTRTPLGPYGRPLSRVLGGSWGGVRFLMGEVQL